MHQEVSHIQADDIQALTEWASVHAVAMHPSDSLVTLWDSFRRIPAER
jgi:hypothetical protein